MSRRSRHRTTIATQWNMMVIGHTHSQPVIMQSTKAFPTSNTHLLITVGFY